MVGVTLEEEPLELRTTLWAPAGSPSLEARVTSMKSAVHERGSFLKYLQSKTRVEDPVLYPI